MTEQERLVVGAVIVDDAGRAFVHRRGPDRTLFPNYWDIPGGHVEPGEAPLEALSREVEEETGWRVRRVIAELGETHWTGDDGVPRRELDYLVEVDGDLDAPRLEWPDHVEFAWVGPDEIASLADSGAPPDADIRDIVLRGLREAARRTASGA
jgi:8-oxo-dGTP pyrophosphatase MutT (NUDIX family)